MNLLGAILYDPSTAASKATTGALAMTAMDTTNLRLTITVPAHGFVMFRVMGQIVGATTCPTILVGVMNGATVVARVTPTFAPVTANAATQPFQFVAEFIATGLAAGSTSFDLAYAVQVVVALTNIKYGGPNNVSGANAWGAIVFEAWDPQPLTTGLAGGVNLKQWNGAAVVTPNVAGVPIVDVKYDLGNLITVDANNCKNMSMKYVAGDATAATNLSKTTDDICRGTVGSASTTTSIVTSAFTPAPGVVDQFKGRVVIFDSNTTTVALRGQAALVTGSTNSATPTLTVNTMTTAAVSGDTFSLV